MDRTIEDLFGVWQFRCFGDWRNDSRMISALIRRFPLRSTANPICSAEDFSHLCSDRLTNEISVASASSQHFHSLIESSNLEETSLQRRKISESRKNRRERRTSFGRKKDLREIQICGRNSSKGLHVSKDLQSSNYSNSEWDWVASCLSFVFQTFHS